MQRPAVGLAVTAVVARGALVPSVSTPQRALRRTSDGCDRSWTVWDRFTVAALVVGGSLGRWGVTFLAAVAGFEVASLG